MVDEKDKVASLQTRPSHVRSEDIDLVPVNDTPPSTHNPGRQADSRRGMAEENPEIYGVLQPPRNAGVVANIGTGVGRGFPGVILNGGPYSVRMGAPFMPSTNRLVMAFFDCVDQLESPETWSAWCTSQGLAEMALHYESYAHEIIDRVVHHRLFQACRMRFNVNIAISDLMKGLKQELFYHITISGDTRNAVCAAVNYLINCSPKDFVLYLCAPCDFRIFEYLHPKVPVNKFVEGGTPEEIEEAKKD